MFVAIYYFPRFDPYSFRVLLLLLPTTTSTGTPFYLSSSRSQLPVVPVLKKVSRLGPGLTL